MLVVFIRGKLKQGGVDVYAGEDESEAVGEGCFCGPGLDVLPDFGDVFLGSFGLEVQFLDAVGELLVVDFELDPGYFGDVY